MRSVKHGRKKSVRYRYNTSAAKRQHTKYKKMRKFKGCQALENAWKDSLTTRQNLSSIGIAYDPNEAMEVDSNLNPFKKQKNNKNDTNQILNELEQIAIDEANESDKQKKRKKQKSNLHPNDRDFCEKMISKHGENYQAMSRDPLNIWQHTPKQIERKIIGYKKSLGNEKME
ncbi:hypothetical protein Mgra_00001667 [Meloidogyne graminicola]|uniref:Nucleolar protein 16 n=1 Tax=Meloidogyne graminicola TaxID=189291 RepID=A0A8T0A028_9BILA|nr:hypothetical protein Mgra_00001667 [Meloidogyne graminicola]